MHISYRYFSQQRKGIREDKRAFLSADEVITWNSLQIHHHHFKF